MTDIAESLSNQVSALNENFDKTVKSEGIISKGLGWINNNILGLGHTKNMTKAQLDKYQNLVQKMSLEKI